MNRQEYNKCVGEGLKGKKLSKELRRLEFCILSKTCSGKAPGREEAKSMCEKSIAQPKETKARRHKAPGGVHPRLVLLTTSDCGPCAAAKQYLQPQIDKGLVEVLNVMKDDEAADLAAKFGFTSVPKLLVLDDDGNPFSEIQITDSAQTLS